jgi:2-isopropylmalate synthase
MDYQEHAIGSGADAQAACYVELRVGGGNSRFGVGVASSIMTASFKAILSGVNRHVAAARACEDQAA